MIEFSIALDKILLDAETGETVADVPAGERKAAVEAAYAFLGGDVAVKIEGGAAEVAMPHQPSRTPDDAMKLHRRASKHAERGDYERAIGVLKTVTRDLPMYDEGRRNLGMALLESGQVDEAKEVLTQAVRLHPGDAWGYLLLGNLLAKHQNKFEAAERMYQAALKVEPGDPFTLTSYGGLCAETERFDEAIRMFRQALEVEGAYPNAYYGLALVLVRTGAVDEAVETLDQLFDAERVGDPRYQGVYGAARELYFDLVRRAVGAEHSALMDAVEERRRELSRVVGTEIELVEDAGLKDVQAVAETAWKPGRDRHRIRYAPSPNLVVPHLVAHELEHIAMEHEDRLAGVNRMFTSSAASRERAIRAIAPDIKKLSRKGYNEGALTGVVLELVNGLVRQLYNCPLDMVVESRLHEELPELRPAQLVSLDVTNRRSLEVVSNPDIERLTPRLVYEASTALNCAYAMFTDHLTGGRTAFAEAYSGRAVAVGGRLFSVFEDAAGPYEPGAEYDLVDEFARVLRLQQWYEWLADTTQDEEERPEGVTNPELLKEKQPASVMYCLGALERFAGMSREEVMQVAAEAALVGRGGIDYASSEQKYRLGALPGETFSGLQLLCMMYVGFQQTDPSIDLGLDLKDAYETALTLFDK